MADPAPFGNRPVVTSYSKEDWPYSREEGYEAECTECGNCDSPHEIPPACERCLGRLRADLAASDAEVRRLRTENAHLG